MIYRTLSLRCSMDHQRDALAPVSPSTRQEVRAFIRHYYPVEMRVAAKLIGQQAKWHWE